jgi:single-stranded DNA-binding protein
MSGRLSTTIDRPDTRTVEIAPPPTALPLPQLPWDAVAGTRSRAHGTRERPLTAKGVRSRVQRPALGSRNAPRSPSPMNGTRKPRPKGATDMEQILTLTGYLGRDPQLRETRSRTLTRTETRQRQFVYDHAGRRTYDDFDIVEDQLEYEVTYLPRTFAVLSLATHTWDRGNRSTAWHRVVAWNADRQHFGIRRLAKGDRVEITGRKTSFEAEDGQIVEQIELMSFRLLSRKPNPAQSAPPRSEKPAQRSASARVFRTSDGRIVALAGEPIIRRPA